MGDQMWRFPGAGYGVETGLSDSNSELFKGDTLAGLARETVQNSIDAKINKDGCVRVEFRCFDVDRSAIPDIDELERRIDEAIETYKDTEGETIDSLYEMKKGVSKQTIHCCRVSDFNTTGLVGILDPDQSKPTPYHLLIKGSGISNKSSTSGGSKGVGKYAAFANSEFGTVFYSSRTIDDDEGYVGVSKLCSAKQKDTDEYTQGMGFYGNDIKNSAIPGLFSLEPNFTRNESGTDIYILGFSEHENWEQEVISKLLDSFFCAVYLGFLELKVGQFVINKDNLHQYVFDSAIINPKSSDGKSVIAQYYLFEKSDGPHTFSVGDYGDATLYVLDCSNQYTDFATNNSCIMIRYPYMKIKLSNIEDVQWPLAAMCIIQDNKLNEMLRSVENPQHRDWEFKRLNSKPQEKKKLSDAYDILMQEITEYIKDTLYISSSEPYNLIGAEEFIPMEDKGKTGDISIDSPSENQNMNLKPSLSTRKRRIQVISTSAEIPDEDGYGVSLDFSEEQEGDDELLTAESMGSTFNGGFKPSDESSQESSISDDGRVVMKPAPLRSMKYRFVCLNKKKREFAIAFTSEYDSPKTTLEIYEVDDAGQPDKSEQVSIFSATVNGEPVYPIGFYTIPLSISKGEKVKIVFQTDKSELFSAEVKVYAYR